MRGVVTNSETGEQGVDSTLRAGPREVHITDINLTFRNVQNCPPTVKRVMVGELYAPHCLSLRYRVIPLLYTPLRYPGVYHCCTHLSVPGCIYHCSHLSGTRVYIYPVLTSQVPGWYIYTTVLTSQVPGWYIHHCSHLSGTRVVYTRCV